MDKDDEAFRKKHNICWEFTKITDDHDKEFHLYCEEPLNHIDEVDRFHYASCQLDHDDGTTTIFHIRWITMDTKDLE